MQKRTIHIKPICAVAVGALLIPVNQYWLMRAETIYPGTFSTLLTIFYNVTFTLFVLVAANTALRRVAPRTAFGPSELLIVFVMLTVATGIFGHDLMLVLVQSLAGTGWYATPENDWANLFLRHLPSWLRIDDEAAQDYFLGESALYYEAHIRAWYRPVLYWSTFIVVLLFVTLCLTAVVRRQWTEHEKLAYPIIQLPIALATGNSILRNRMLWLGFTMAGTLDLMNGLHAYIPVIPVFTPSMDIGTYMTENPWTAARPLVAWIYPFVVGLGYFLPVNLSLSAWFFYLMWKAELVFRAAIGVWETPGPFRSYQTAGSWMILTAIVAWTGRRHLRDVIRTAIRGKLGTGDEGEPMRYRSAVIGLAGGVALLVAMLVMAGLSIWVGALFILIYLAYMIAICRIRAEAGPPSHGGEFMGPEQVLLNIFGPRRIGPKNVALFSGMYWMSRAYRSVPVGHQLEGFKTAQVAGGSGRVFLTAMVIASVVGTFSGFWIFLEAMYRYGAANVQHQIGMEPFQRLQPWILTPGHRNYGLLREMGIGAVVTGILMVFHHRYVGFPFHPVGYAIAGGSVMEKRAWFSILLAWAIKTTILTVGGPGLYRRFVPFFAGLILGQHIVGGLWTIVGIAQGEVVYRFFR